MWEYVLSHLLIPPDFTVKLRWVNRDHGLVLNPQNYVQDFSRMTLCGLYCHLSETDFGGYFGDFQKWLAKVLIPYQFLLFLEATSFFFSRNVYELEALRNQSGVPIISCGRSATKGFTLFKY